MHKPRIVQNIKADKPIVLIYCGGVLPLFEERGQGTRPPPVADKGSASWRSGQNSVKRKANKEFWVPQEDLLLFATLINFQATI